jgi:hypothetical protein
MTVLFEQQGEGRVAATIRAYLIRQPRTEGPPALAWERTVVLRGIEACTADRSS